jgi:hypothetical protein
MPAIWEDPRSEYRFQEIQEDEERYRAANHLETWEQCAGEENGLRRANSYCLAPLVPPTQWDGHTNSALQYLLDTRVMAPSSSHHAPLPRFNLRPAEQSRQPSPAPPTYSGPPPENWFLNHSLVPTERARSQRATSMAAGSRDGHYEEDYGRDVNMHHDDGAGPSNFYRSSRFAAEGDGPYARLQRRF